MIFTDFLFEKLSHLRIYYNSDAEFKEHLMSGEVTIPIPDVISIYNEFLLLKDN